MDTGQKGWQQWNNNKSKYTQQDTQGVVKPRIRLCKVQTHITVNIDIIFANILIQTHF